MSRLNVPSLQHLARNWREDPLWIMRLLVRLAENPPRLNYNPLFSAVRDMLVLGVPYEQIVKGVYWGVQRPDVRDNFLGVLPLIRDYFAGVSPTYIQTVQRRYYPAGRGLLIPFEPPLIYGVRGQIHFPWFSFWRRNPIANRGLSLFVTIVEDVLLQDPDLEDANFLILDFSTPGPKQPRTLKVINAADIPRVTAAEREKMLSIFVEGFELAKAVLAAGSSQPKGEHPTDPDQGNFDF